MRLLATTPLPLIRIEAPKDSGYDYKNKYFTDDVKYHCPSGIRADLEERIPLDDPEGVSRIGLRRLGGAADMMLAEDGRIGFLELNTSPGMTGHSLVPMAAKAVGMSYPIFVYAFCPMRGKS